MTQGGAIEPSETLRCAPYAVRMCGELEYGPPQGMPPYVCTREHGHEGDHAAHCSRDEFIASWPR